MLQLTMNRADAWALLTEYTASESLRKHAMAVEAAVRGYARKFGENEEAWGVTALLHDFDYERWPTLGDHPNKGSEILRERGYPEWVIRAIRSHATEITGVTRDGLLERTLFACDEMAGFITAASLVRPSRSVLDLEAKSVVRRMKDKAFARAVKREDLVGGAELLGLPLDEHIGNVIAFMRERAAHIPGMNAVTFVAYCGELAGLPRLDAVQRAHEVLFYVGLGEARYRNVETYSTGMKQRIKLAQALVHDPDLLLLDEPTNGMDPKGRDEMLALVHDLAHGKGVNVIVSSHLLPDVEYTCDHVIVLDKGRIATSGPIAALKQPRGQVFELRVKAPDLQVFVDR